MEDLILALLSGTTEILIEVIVQFIVEVFIALIIRSIRNLAGESRAIDPTLAALGYLLLGAACGAGSVILFPHPIILPSKVHGISLVVSPVITGLIMSQIGLLHRRKGEDAVRIESFGYGFTFAFGVAVVRFVFVR
jgi:hypothetical protein